MEPETCEPVREPGAPTDDTNGREPRPVWSPRHGPGFKPEEHGFRPRPSPARIAAMRRADTVIDETFPGMLVAYVDNWTGDELDRVVVVAATTTAEFHRQLTGLESEVRRRVEMTQ